MRSRRWILLYVCIFCCCSSIARGAVQRLPILSSQLPLGGPPSSQLPPAVPPSRPGGPPSSPARPPSSLGGPFSSPAGPPSSLDGLPSSQPPPAGTSTVPVESVHYIAGKPSSALSSGAGSSQKSPEEVAGELPAPDLLPGAATPLNVSHGAGPGALDLSGHPGASEVGAPFKLPRGVQAGRAGVALARGGASSVYGDQLSDLAPSFSSVLEVWRT